MYLLYTLTRSSESKENNVETEYFKNNGNKKIF